MNILQKILAVISGVAVGMIFVLVGDYGASLIVPFPKDIDMSNKQNLVEFMSHVPVSAFLAMLTGYMAGAFLGGLVATLISGREFLRPAMVVGIILTISNIFNQMEIPHPLWFTVVSTLVYIPMAWCGYRILRPKVSA